MSSNLERRSHTAIEEELEKVFVPLSVGAPQEYAATPQRCRPRPRQNPLNTLNTSPRIPPLQEELHKVLVPLLLDAQKTASRTAALLPLATAMSPDKTVNTLTRACTRGPGRFNSA